MLNFVADLLKNKNITVSKNAIYNLIYLALNSCDGVVGLCAKNSKTSISGILKEESVAKGIDLKYKKNSVEVTVHIAIEYGSNLKEVSQKALEKLQNELNNLLQNCDIEVNIVVEGVVRSSVLKEKKCESDVSAVVNIEEDKIGYVSNNDKGYCAMLGEKEIAFNENVNEVAKNLVEYMLQNIPNPAIIAVYYKQGTDDTAFELSDWAEEKYSTLDIELHCVAGTQNEYIIGVE